MRREHEILPISFHCLLHDVFYTNVTGVDEGEKISILGEIFIDFSPVSFPEIFPAELPKHLLSDNILSCCYGISGN